MNKHTPGPWTAHEYGSPTGHWYVRGPRDEKIIHGPSLNNEANAHLIAAAPDLLEQTKLLERALLYEIKKSENDGDNEGARLKGVTLGIVREVLAKAEGR